MLRLKVTETRIILFILMVITIGKVNVYATEIIGSQSKSDSTIIEYLKEDEKNTENVERIEKYLAINGAKV